jgi:hypothetical protein
MSIWIITSMNLPSDSTAADPERVASYSIAYFSRQYGSILSATEILLAGGKT